LFSHSSGSEDGEGSKLFSNDVDSKKIAMDWCGGGFEIIFSEDVLVRKKIAKDEWVRNFFQMMRGFETFFQRMGGSKKNQMMVGS